MKTIRLFFAVFLLTALCSLTTLQAQTNLLTNPGFETSDDTGVSPASWSIDTEGGIATVTLSSESIQEGSRSLKIVADDNNGLVRISQYIEIKAGEKYNLSIWFNVISPLDGYFYTGYEFLNSNGEAISNKLNDYYPNSSNVWSQIQYQEIEAPANAAYLKFKIETSYSANLYIDNASVTEVGAVSKQDQTIAGLSDMTQTVGDADFDLSATASSGLAVTYASSNTAVATISGSTVHVVGVGSTTITASQAGNDTYNAATNVTATLTVNAASTSKNLVTNPGFENVKDGVPDGWTTSDASSTMSITSASDMFYNGSKSLKVNISDDESTALVYQYVAVKQGKQYDLSIWANIASESAQGGTRVYLYYDFVDANGTSSNITNSSRYNYTLNQWGEITIQTVEAPANAAYLMFQFRGKRTLTAYIDNACVIEVVAAGINETTADQKSLLPVRKEGNNLVVNTESGKTIEVYSVVGAKLQSKVAESDETVISGLPKGQLLIIRNGNAVAKIVL
jgi:hypothetical protein